MRRILLLALTIGVAALAVPTASEAYLTGVADQSAAMFVNKYYTQLVARQASSQRISRYILPYDADDGTRANVPYLNQFINWYNHAKAAHVKMLVALYHSEQPKKVLHMPSVAAYSKDVKRLLSDKRFSQVEAWQPWNESNRGLIPHVLASPSALQSAEYYKVFRSTCPAATHKHCTILALDVLDQNNVGPSIAYINQFKSDLAASQGKGLGPVPTPTLWGLHNYSDTNRFSTQRTRAVLAAVPGQIWLTETGGIVQFGGAFPNRHGSGDTRASKALTFLFRLANSNHRIARLYIFQFSGATSRARFDAGLVDAKGVPRPGYVVVCKQLHAAKCSGFKIDKTK
jgi:hypothetical protein